MTGSVVRSPGVSRPSETPWHLWVVGVFFHVLSLAGARDSVLSLTLNKEYFEAKGFGTAQIAYFTDYPHVPLWTVAVAGGIVSALLLLSRSRWAVPVALVSAGANLCLVLATFGFKDRWNVFGPWMSLFDFVILALTFGLWAYCRAMLSRGVLG